jgi:hypothetical protein
MSGGTSPAVIVQWSRKKLSARRWRDAISGALLLVAQSIQILLHLVSLDLLLKRANLLLALQLVDLLLLA